MGLVQFGPEITGRIILIDVPILKYKNSQCISQIYVFSTSKIIVQYCIIQIYIFLNSNIIVFILRAASGKTVRDRTKIIRHKSDPRWELRKLYNLGFLKTCYLSFFKNIVYDKCF